MNPWHHFEPSKTSSLTSRALLTIFWTSSVLFALCIFLYGFFPMKVVSGDIAGKDDIPTKLLNVSLETDVLYQRRIGRFVFVLIDAFRWDFLETAENMPYISELRRLNQAMVFTARCHPPTATMPRVKALMTGSVPNFIDVVLNLGSNQVMEDNLILQATKNGLNVVFYGDEVWLSLFPDKFIRKDGTTSFFVSDFTEVDINVTRHIPEEFSKEDWDIMILHYLGLDHIGHLAGPSSSLVPPKLREMDSVIQTLHRSLKEWDMKHPEEPSYLVIAGDHGMHDSGSHGGATPGEVLVSLVVIESLTKNMPLSRRPEVSQIDFAVTLSILLGLPIPKMSLGVLIPQALGRLTHEQYLFALFYNAKQVADQFLAANPNGRQNDFFVMFLEAQITHLSWLEGRTEALKIHAEALYSAAVRGMSSYVVKNLVSFDLCALTIGCLILFLVLVCSSIAMAVKNSDMFWNKGIRIFWSFVQGSAVLFTYLLVIGYFNTLFALCERYLCIAAFAFFIVTLLCWNLFYLPRYLQARKYMNLQVMKVFLLFGCILHSASLSSSSLIEEEHQTWYFLWVTLLVLIFISVSSAEKTSHHLQSQVLCMLLSHRVLRKLNQTGDKWASLPDIADWLAKPEQQVLLFFIFLTGLVGVWISLFKLKCIVDAVDKVLYSLALACVYRFRCVAGDITFPHAFEISRGVWEVQIFWLVCGLILIRAIRRFNTRLSSKDIIQTVTSMWVLASSLLLRPCNVVLIPYLALSSFTLQGVLRQPVYSSIGHLWLGNVVYFYQGNSNSLSTVDIAAGYIGAEQQNVLSAGLLVLVHTFCFPILATLLQWFWSCNQTGVLQRRRENIVTMLHVSLLQRLLPLSVYCLVVYLQRNHLFIWSVFAPKLIYEAVQSVVNFALVVLGCILFINCDN